MPLGNHYKLAPFFASIMNPNVLASILVIGDSMTAENAQKGNATNGIWESWEPPIPTENKVSHWLGRSSQANRSGNNTHHGESQTAASIAGGTATTITPSTSVTGADRPNLFGPGSGSPAANSVGGRNDFSPQEYLDIAWGAGTRTGTGGSPVSIYNAHGRMNQQGVTTPWGYTMLGVAPAIHRSQQASAKLIWRAHASSPASNIEVIGTRRSTTTGGTNFGVPTGTPVAPDFSANPDTIQSVNVDCGTGVGEPGVMARSIGTNAGAESLFLLGNAWYTRPTSSTWYSSGWLLSCVGLSGANAVDLASMLGGDDNRDGQILVPVCSNGLAQSYLGALCSYGTVAGPTHVIFRVGQNLNSSTQNPGTNYTDGSDMEIFRTNMRHLIDTVRNHCLALQGEMPMMLIEGRIRTSSSDSTTQAVNAVLRELAVEYDCAYWDGWLRTRDQPLTWYTSAENQSTSGDNVHESHQGARWVQRMVFEDGMRALGRDHGMWGFETRPPAATGGIARLRGRGA